MSETLQLVQVVSDEHESHVRNLLSEYIQWLQEKAKQEYGISVNLDTTLQAFMKGFDVFYPPRGRMYLSKVDGEIVGMGCLKQLDNNVGEIKRMFVRSEYRGRGIGKQILEKLIAEARSIGYTKVYLDSPKFSIEAHRLYQSMGFKFTESYQGSEGAEAGPGLAVFMELVL
jgi:GNAT superfamily N-acetyltransferase